MDKYFDALYDACDRYWWQGSDRYAPDPDSHSQSLLTQLTLRLLRERPAGRALDLGAGEGADAVRLALLGYQVDAVDISQAAVAKIARFASEAGVGQRVRVSRRDIEEYIPPADAYDVVICNGVLHYVADKLSVVTRIQGATLAGGLNVVSLWSAYTAVPEGHDSVDVYCDEEDGVVTRLYRAWPKELLYFERDKLETSHTDLPAHRHSHIKLIARRPA